MTKKLCEGQEIGQRGGGILISPPTTSPVGRGSKEEYMQS